MDAASHMPCILFLEHLILEGIGNVIYYSVLLLGDRSCISRWQVYQLHDP
jgi:hypothetical protein